MEKTVEGGDPEKCQMDHQPSVIGGHSRFCCRSKPTHAKCPDDGNGQTPWDQRLANEDADSRHDIHNAPESHDGRKGADEMHTDLTETRTVGVEWVLRCQHQSHPSCYYARDECEKNRGRMGELCEKTSHAQCCDKRGAGTQTGG